LFRILTDLCRNSKWAGFTKRRGGYHYAKRRYSVSQRYPTQKRRRRKRLKACSAVRRRLLRSTENHRL